MSVRRREFLGVCASLAATPMLVACASVLVRQVPTVNGRVELPLTQYPELTEAGSAFRILPDGHEQPLIVVVGTDGGFTVLSSECTHLACTVEVQGERLVCPCHGSTYDRKGDVMRGPAERPLRRYRARLAGGDVLVIDLA